MSAIPTYYLQSCSVCGRSLQVPVELLGQKVACRHCGATFVARAPAAARAAKDDRGESLWRRVDALLDRARLAQQMG